LELKKKSVEKEAPSFDEKAVILGSINMESAGARFVQAIGTTKIEDDATFEDKIEDIEIVFKEKNIPSVSIAPTLTEALKFKDTPVILTCLSQTNERLIKETVLIFSN
jgi:hypothetical protein